MITRQPNHLGRLAIVCQLVACTGGPREVWISPDGKDGGLEAARDALRGTGGIVHVHGGRYELSHPLRLDERDAGISFVAVADEEPFLSGGMIIHDLTQPLAVDDIRQIWIDGVRAPRARGVVPELQLLADGYLATSPLTFADPRALELVYFETWQHKLCGVDAIEGAHIIVRQPCFSFVTHDDGRPSTLPDFFEHAPELIDEPGEWYWNRATHSLDIAGDVGEVIVPIAEQLVDIRGASDVQFDGITFADTSWLRPSTDGYPDVQAGFVVDPANVAMRDDRIINPHNEYLRMPGAVRATDSRQIRFERCTFTRLGGSGVDFVRTDDSVIVASRFEDIAGNAIQLGDVRIAERVRGNVIDNNVIRTAGAQYEDSVGIFVGYADATRVTHNDLADLPYSAISVGWGWGEDDAITPSGSDNVVEGNAIARVMLRREDGAGIYVLGNQPGTVIQRNHIVASTGSPGGIYLDEGTANVEVTGNSVSDVPVPYFPHTSREATCAVHDNFFGSDVDVGAGLTILP